MFKRQLTETLVRLQPWDKVVLLIGPRQVGKTTLIKTILSDREYLFINGDDPSVRELLARANTEVIRSIIGSNKVVFIDEAQRIDNIGITLKLIHDQFPHVELIVSGSSAFELKNNAGEPLTGRKRTNLLFPISWKELEDKEGFLAATQQLELRLLYGMYPDVLNNAGEERDILTEITDSYLFRDILAFGGIRKPDVLNKILRALAFQVGGEVSLNEISRLVGVDKNTVSSYINLLEQGYVIFPQTSFSRNLRNEIKTNVKYYFYDNGIRNAIIQNFQPVDNRQDKGALWENFLIAERVKQHHYLRSHRKMYFWRTVSQQEIDLIEEVDGQLFAFEFKWKEKGNFRTPRTFREAYNVEAIQIHRENYYSFVRGEDLL